MQLLLTAGRHGSDGLGQKNMASRPGQQSEKDMQSSRASRPGQGSQASTLDFMHITAMVGNKAS